MSWTLVLRRSEYLFALMHLDGEAEKDVVVVHSDETLLSNAVGKVVSEVQMRDEERLKKVWPDDGGNTRHALSRYDGYEHSPAYYDVLLAVPGTVEPIHYMQDYKELPTC